MNSLDPGICGSSFESVTFEHMLAIKFMTTSREIPLRWMPMNTLDDNIGSGNGLVPTGNQPLPEPWPRSMSPNGIAGQVIHLKIHVCF